MLTISCRSINPKANNPLLTSCVATHAPSAGNHFTRWTEHSAKYEKSVSTSRIEQYAILEQGHLWRNNSPTWAYLCIICYSGKLLNVIYLHSYLFDFIYSTCTYRIS